MELSKENIQKVIESNTAKISKLAFRPHFKAASELNHGSVINGDIRLDRMTAAISIIYHLFNAEENLIALQLQCIQLNILRSSYSFKPEFMDLAVEKLEQNLFYLAIEYGLGEYQLAEIVYLFPSKLIEKLELTYLYELR